MKRVALFLGLTLTLSTPALAGDAKSYQVTGPLVSVTNDAITVMKGKDKWEIAKDAATKTSGEVKEGDKVTVMYRMTATSIEAKAGTGKTGAKSK
jgi:hypothetical protein